MSFRVSRIHSWTGTQSSLNRWSARIPTKSVICSWYVSASIRRIESCSSFRIIFSIRCSLSLSLNVIEWTSRHLRSESTTNRPTDSSSGFILTQACSISHRESRSIGIDERVSSSIPYRVRSNASFCMRLKNTHTSRSVVIKDAPLYLEVHWGAN